MDTECAMRMNIEIDDDLMLEAMQCSGAREGRRGSCFAIVDSNSLPSWDEAASG
jgi:hypothetical protein